MKELDLSEPFPYLICDDFLSSEMLSNLEENITQTLNFQKHPAGYSFGAIFDDFLIRHLYRYVRNTVGPKFQKQYGFSAVYKLPQIYKVTGPWLGLPPHMDDQPGRDLAMIIYLSRDWQPGFGSELRLLDKNMRPFKIIEPLFNRAVFFPLGKDSWHEVLSLKSNWTRITLIQDWAETI